MPDTSHLTGSKEVTKDLLLEDYRYISELFHRNEQSGETRLNLFIGIVSLVISALALIITSEKPPFGENSIQLIIIVSLIALIFLGFITMARMLMRNESTDRQKQGLDTIRQVFMDHFDDEHILTEYHPFRPPQKINENERETMGGLQFYEKEIIHRKFGGLAHTVAAINSLLIAGLVGAILYSVPLQNLTIGNHVFVITAFCLSFLLMYIYVVRRDISSKKKLREGIPTHAGGIVYQMKEGVPHYLLVRPSNNCREWVLPKGHIRQGEWHGETALREVREETGVVACLICHAGDARFKTHSEDVYVKFYLMELLVECNPSENREKLWCCLETALDKGLPVESRCILKQAETLRKSKADRGS